MIERLAPISFEAACEVWGWLEPRCPLPRLRERLESGESRAFHIVDTDAVLVLAAGKAKDTGAVALWIECLGGHVGYRAKDNARLLKTVLTDCNEIARLAGCTDIRIEAANRLPLKERLFARHGFERTTVLGKPLMRKAVDNG